MMKGQRGFVQIPHRAVPDVSRQPTASTLWQRLARWYELARQRHALAALSDGALKDLGLSRADILGETERPFWDDPLKK